jgi:predicted acylesterase/phospholipase RssA
VYGALASSEYLPDWVAGISIGAINAEIIAGNEPDNRVKHLRALQMKRCISDAIRQAGDSLIFGGNPMVDADQHGDQYPPTVRA